MFSQLLYGSQFTDRSNPLVLNLDGLLADENNQQDFDQKVSLLKPFLIGFWGYK